MPLPLLGSLCLWYFLVFPWNSFWISCHQILFWYSDHCIYFLIVVLSPAGRSWWFFVKSASYFATYSRSCMGSEYLALLCPRYCCCNYLFERENIDNVFFDYFCIIYNLITKLKLATNFGHCKIELYDRFVVHKANWGPLAPFF